MKIRYGLAAIVLTALAGCSSMQSAPVENVNKKPTPSGLETAAPNPTASKYNVELGVGYLQQGDMERAKHKLLLAVQQDNKSPTALDAMAYYAENTGDDQAAEKYYRQALDLDPKGGRTNNNYAAFLCKNKRYVEADKYFQVAVQDPNYLKTAEASENAGTCALQIPDPVKAEQYLQKAVQQDPNRATAYLGLAQIEFNQKNYPQAKQNFDKYMQLNSDPSAEALWLGVQLAEQNKDEEAAGHYRLMLQLRYPRSTEKQQMVAQQRAKKLSDDTSDKVFQPNKLEQPSY